MKRLPLLLVCMLAAASVQAEIVIDDFEDVSDWSGLDRDTGLFVEGSSSGRWDDHPGQTAVSKTFGTPLDASAEDTVSVWIHSEVANGALIAARDALVALSGGRAPDREAAESRRGEVLRWLQRSSASREVERGRSR